jgi:hypothetical protein
MKKRFWNIFPSWLNGIILSVIGSLIAAFIFPPIKRFFESIGLPISALIEILNYRIPLFLIIAVGLAILLLIKLKSWKLSDKEVFVISVLDEGERGLDRLFKAYKKAFPAESRTISNCTAIIKKLERKKLIEMPILTGGIGSVQDEVFRLTKKGLKKYKKLDVAIKERGQALFFSEVAERARERIRETLIEPSEEVMFFLKLLANQVAKSMTFRVIEPDYRKRFPSKERADFQVLINNLEKAGLIEEIPMGTMMEIGYKLLREGLEYFQLNRQE